MKLAHNDIEQYLNTTLGETFSVGSTEWKYFTNPPKGAVPNKYVWCGIDLLIEAGTKNDFIGTYLLELTIVDRAGANYTDNADADLCANYLGGLLVERGRQITTSNFNFIAWNFDSVESSLEHQAQETVIVRKLIFSILAEEL